MARNLKALVLLTKSQPPSSRLRFLDCEREFAAHGVEATYARIMSGPLERLKLFLRVRDYDVVIIQKKTSFRGFELNFMRSLNPNLIFDFDDAVMFHELEHSQPLTGKNVLKFIRTISRCKAVVAGNDFLAEFARPNCPEVYVLPTPIDTDRYRLKDYGARTGNIVIGWIGVSGNLRYLKRLEPVLHSISAKYPDVVVRIISNDTVNLQGVRQEFKKWRLDEEIEDLRGLDIGIMPLDSSLWALGKCGYKILQYLGVGIPPVASPVGINAKFITHGVNGFLASDPEEWEHSLETLVRDAALRQEMGARGRQRVEELYSLKQYSARYVHIMRKVAGT